MATGLLVNIGLLLSLFRATVEAEDQVEQRLLLDTVVCKASAILELLFDEDESLLVWWDAFLVLDLSLDVVDGVGGLDFQRNGLPYECFDEDLHGCSWRTQRLSLSLSCFE
ncbi:hypothetical protein QYF36_008109 [Acer negundo]|nr:hypothetical protein QYF36_008109 [Acer negundo]